MFNHTEEQIAVFTDTLATHGAGEPFLFYNKCLPIPTMSLLVAVTGYGDFLERWVSHLRGKILARDIVMLDAHAPEALRRLWDELGAEDGPLTSTCTIYHFGVEEDTGRCVRYVYRSEHDFESERYDVNGQGLKPPPTEGLTDEIRSSLQSIEGWIDLAVQIRAEQDALPRLERVYIGGELMLTTIDADSIIRIDRLHTWEDYNEHWNAMNGWPPAADFTEPDPAEAVISD